MTDRADILRGRAVSLYEDLAMFTCGQYLGGGIGREVFVLRTDETKVIKFASSFGNQNVIEYELWQIIESDKDLKPWFAPVHGISGHGQWMIQSRTHPIELKDCPKKVPAIFTDIKAENWGWLDGRPVCHDYGSILCRLFTSRASKLRDVSKEWY
jgi:hypothetical protein